LPGIIPNSFSLRRLGILQSRLQQLSGLVGESVADGSLLDLLSLSLAIGMVTGSDDWDPSKLSDVRRGRRGFMSTFSSRSAAACFLDFLFAAEWEDELPVVRFGGARCLSPAEWDEELLAVRFGGARCLHLPDDAFGRLTVVTFATKDVGSESSCSVGKVLSSRFLVSFWEDELTESESDSPALSMVLMSPSLR
jgi:hypothetical protein